MKPRGVVAYLTQDTPERQAYLQNSLYFLFRHFNERYEYPVRVFHEHDYSRATKSSVLSAVRRPLRDLVEFVELEDTHFTVPDWIDIEAVGQSISRLPKSRSMGYRLMCRWWLMHSHQYLSDFEYIMRLDDDLILEEPLREDLFLVMDGLSLDLASNIVHIDNPIFTHGLRNLLAECCPGQRDLLSRIFVSGYVERANLFGGDAAAFLRAVPCSVPAWDGSSTLPAPIMYYNNFGITRTDFWLQPRVRTVLDRIDQHGGIFYLRWGDAPVQTLLSALLAGPTRMGRFKFRYSKRNEREKDPYYNSGIYHAWDILRPGGRGEPNHTALENELSPVFAFRMPH